MLVMVVVHIMKTIVILFSVLLVGSFLLVITIGRTGAVPPASVPPESCPYTVKEGDTLIKIAARLTGSGKNYPQIMQFNDLTSDLIAPGEVLHIPQKLLLEEFQCSPQATPVPTQIPNMTLSSEPTPAPTPTVTPVPTLTPPPQKGRKILAEIEGIVFNDKNGNNQPDAGEAGIQGVKVILIKGRVNQSSMTGITAITDKKGKFLFTNVDPGSQAVGLYETTLPEGAALMTVSTVVITLSEGDKGYIKFAVKMKEN